MTYIETLAVHEGQTIDAATGAVTPPIHLSTTFERQADGSYPHGFDYTRSGNPNRAALEAAVAALEGGATAAAFASGSAAMMAILQALKPGDHVIAPGDMYFGIQRLLREVFAPWGLAASFIDMTNLDELRGALRPETRLVIVETPSNPQLKVTDIRAVADLAHAVGAVVLVDNTIPTPVLQRPFLQSADLVIHASTKSLGGHSDVLGGIVVAREETPLFDQIRLIQKIGGAVPSPFDCWLTLRGIQTLPIRVRAQTAHAQHVAEFLAGHPAVEAVLYPGLPTHEAFATAVRQMAGGGGLLSILVRGDAAAATAVAGRVQLFTRATSFGGTHSLIEHRASIEAPGTLTPPNLLRLAIGLEHPADLIADLDQALGAVIRNP
jgi:cystathionine gamma-synthase